MPFLIFSELARFNPDSSSFSVMEAESKVAFGIDCEKQLKAVTHLSVTMYLERRVD